MRQDKNLSIMRLMGLWRGLSHSTERISLSGIMTEVGSLGLSSVWQRMTNFNQMQKIWSAIIVTRKGTTKKICRVLKHDLEDKKNQESFAYSISVANDESDDSKASTNLLTVSSSTDFLIDLGFFILLAHIIGRSLRHLNPIMLVLF